MRGKLRFFAVGVAAAFASVFSCAGRASADTILLSLNGTPTVSGSYYLWSYTVTLDSNSQLDASGSYTTGSQGGTATGDGATLYDLPGFVGGTAAFSPASLPSGDGFNVSQSALGGYGFTGVEPDASSAVNVSLSFVLGAGGTIADPPTSTLGTLTFLDTVNTIVVNSLTVGSNDDVLGTATPPAGGYNESASNVTDGPTPGTPQVLPLPVSAGAGILLLGLAVIVKGGIKTSDKHLAL